MILYEYPFNESMRTMLRLEHLFKRMSTLMLMALPSAPPPSPPGTRRPLALSAALSLLGVLFAPYIIYLMANGWSQAEGANAVIVSAAIESELVGMDAEERMVFLEEMGLHETGLARVIRSGYDLLHLITFFTVGPKEARAWTVHRGAKAPEAAGEIHSDMQRGFIRAETIAFDDFVTLGGETACKDAGKLRQEGKEYVVQDGDVMHFKFNV